MLPPSMPAWFRSHGYHTLSVGKVSHHPGGRGGPDWNQEDILEMPFSWDQHLLPSGPWKHPRGWMHGLAHGEIRIKAGDMALFQSVDGGDEIYPDGPSVDLAVDLLNQMTPSDASPFFLAVGLLKPLTLGAPADYYRRYRDLALPPPWNTLRNLPGRQPGMVPANS